MTWLGFYNPVLLAAVSNKNRIEIKSDFGKVICPSGTIINLPIGIKLEVSEHKFGDQSIVLIPKRISKKCSYGILKYSHNMRTGDSLGEQKKNAKKSVKYSLVAEKMNYADKCKDEFISSQGLGNWGKYVKKELSSKLYVSLLKNSKTFENVCPGYPLMKLEERKNLWVFILMSMSHYESSCRPQVEAQGPNGIAKGLFQLHDNFENKYSQWDLDGICKKGGARNPKDSLKCTLSMLNGQVEKYNSLFFKKSYWDVLRKVNEPDTHAFKIKNAIGMLKGCEVRTIASKEPNTQSNTDKKM
jgi:hypothetical protein